MYIHVYICICVYTCTERSAKLQNWTHLLLASRHVVRAYPRACHRAYPCGYARAYPAGTCFALTTYRNPPTLVRRVFSISQSISQSISHSVSQSVSQWSSESVSEAVSQWISQSKKKKNKLWATRWRGRTKNIKTCNHKYMQHVSKNNSFDVFVCDFPGCFHFALKKTQNL